LAVFLRIGRRKDGCYIKQNEKPQKTQCQNAPRQASIATKEYQLLKIIAKVELKQERKRSEETNFG